MNQSARATTDYTPIATANGTIEGSGQEDVGFRRTLEFSSREALARIESQRHRDAEHLAWQRHTDKDRILQAALDTLESEAVDKSLLRNGTMNYIAGAANIPLSQFPGDDDRAQYVRELLMEIRLGLSPVVRG